MQQSSSDVYCPSRVIITGASGWLATETALQLRNAFRDTELIGVSRSCFTEEFFNTTLTNDAYVSKFSHAAGDIVIHCAFCRKNEGQKLVNSLEWSGTIFSKAMAEGASGIINISSQSVFSGGAAHNTEQVAPSPSSLYALAKASSELLLEGMATAANYHGGVTSLRMASLMGVSSNRCPNNILYKFVQAALAGETLNVTGGKQKFSFLSIHDAAAAIVALLKLDPALWFNVYNIGPTEQTPILEMAHTVIDNVSQICSTPKSDVTINASDAYLDSGMVSQRAFAQLGWTPRESFPDIVRETIAHCLATK